MHRATANSGTYDTEREEALSVENAAKNDSDWIRSVVARASTLRERIESGYYIPVAEEGGKERLDRWKELLGIEEQEQWEERLKMSGWTPESVLPLLGSVALKEDAPLPEWGNLLISLLDKPSIPERDIYSDPSVWGVDPDEPLPFEELLLPFVAHGEQLLREHLASNSPAPLDLLSPSALHDLRRELLSELSNLCSRTFMEEFAATRSPAQNLLLSIGATAQQQGREKYTTFVEDHLRDGCRRIVDRYPVLARLLSIRIIDWSRAVALFLLRLQNDYASLIDLLEEGRGDVDGSVEGLQFNQAGFSLHGRGRIALTLVSGNRIVYNPESYGCELPYYRFLAWCQEQGLSCSFADPHLMQREGYSWDRLVQWQSCGNNEEVRAYYHHAGILIILLHLFGAREMDPKGFVASGPSPVLKNLNALFISSTTRDSAEKDILTAKLEHNVMETGLLPYWTIDPASGNVIDISVLGNMGQVQQMCPKPLFRNTNSDGMMLVQAAASLPVSSSIVMEADEVVKPEDYLTQIVQGFEQGANFFLEHRQEMLRPGGPLTGFQNLPTRYIGRSEKVYARLLTYTLQPHFLKNGVDRSIEFDVLSKASFSEDASLSLWSILEQECVDLEAMKIPCFRSSAWQNGSERNAPLASQETTTSAWEILKERINGLEPDGIALQCAMIRESFLARNIYELRQAVPGKPIEEEETEGKLLSREDLIAEAEKIAEYILEKEFRGGENESYWFALSFLFNGNDYALLPLNGNLYNGNCGIALFLGTLFQITGKEKYRRGVLQALELIRSQIKEGDLSVSWAGVDQIGLGGGIGGILYTWFRLGILLDDTAFINEAEELAYLIDDRRIAADHVLDILGGSAGAILALLGLYELTGNQEILSRAVQCGDHLLEQRVEAKGKKVWPTLGTTPLTGYSHGAAGFADALARLYSHTDQERFALAAIEAFQYEDSVYMEEQRNWPDYRFFRSSETTPSCGTQWCHGAAGIGLARLNALSRIQQIDLQQSIEIAMETTLDYGIGVLDDLCCGNAGRIDILLTASLKLNRPDLRTEALRRATLMVERARKHGAYDLSQIRLREPFVPGLFKGTAGIGYALLRLADPETIPSILSFNTPNTCSPLTTDNDN